MTIGGETMHLKVNESALFGANVADADRSSWSVLDANLCGGFAEKVDPSGLIFKNANLAGAQLNSCRLDGMTIDGIEMTEFLEAYRAKEAKGEDANA